MILPKESSHTLAKGLTLDEFKCKCGYSACTATLVDERLVASYDKLRQEVGFPFIITSGYRCPQHNAAVGGNKSSRHMAGEAIDILLTDQFRIKYINLKDFIVDAYHCGLKWGYLNEAKEFYHLQVDRWY